MLMNSREHHNYSYIYNYNYSYIYNYIYSYSYMHNYSYSYIYNYSYSYILFFGFVFGLCSFIIKLGITYRILRTIKKRKEKETHRQKEGQFASGKTNEQRQKNIK